MIVAIGLDSFDTPFAGCTTHLASLITILVKQHDYELADYPWLIRLNPAVPWKTRGNGAIAVLVAVNTEKEAREVVKLAWYTAREYMKLTGSHPHRKDAIVAMLIREADNVEHYLEQRPECLTDLYRRAVTEAVHLRRAEECVAELQRKRLLLLKTSNRQGLIGALSALGAELHDYTFELLTYRKPSNMTKPRVIRSETVIEFDLRYKPLTLLNYDYELDRVLIAPHGYDPVLYGVRGEEPNILARALNIIDPGEEPSHWTIFRSNQATNSHLKRKEISKIRPYDNVIVEGRLSELKPIPGGHVVGTLCDETACITVAFYRETRRLRRIAFEYDGKMVEVGGQVKPHKGAITLNAEYLRDPCTNEVYTPPLSAYHHLMMPLERILFRDKLPPKRLTRPKRILVPTTLNID